ncbi:hypothetical protein [Cloacibacterium sp. TD35]|uniref:hypothetical protein n=1 Tax=Cloacibacterium sp. TD35 TaxID=2976818 RepID=UPI00237D7079|nr:hypothetical protein [Cloacibacterium sp. TD35]WDT68378.1 hypothetical protein N7277_01875 [Cloacibacterium sp. TD35]
MKKSFALAFLFFTLIFSAQNITDYEYIYVPKKFKDFEANEYNLNTLLKKALEGKKYKVIQEELVNWPLELRQNLCKVLSAELLNDSNMFRNRVKLQFFDCEKKLVFEIKATSMYKEFDLGYQDALKTSLENIAVSNPKPIDIKGTIHSEVPKVTDKQEIKPIGSSENTSVASKKTELYSNGSVNFQKVQISKDQFILVSSSSSVPFATFKNTTKADVYRVTLENGTSTLGYSENGNLVIEIPTSDGNYKKEIFTAK